MESNKSLWQILKGTFTGLDQEGSAKRATSFFFVVVLIASLTFVYEYCFYLAVIALVPTSSQLAVVKMFEPLHYSLQLTVWMLCGLATVETVTNLIRTLRGGNPPEKKSE